MVDGVPGLSFLRNTMCPSLKPFGLAICERDPDFDSCQGLLRSLQSSVVSYLGTPFCYTGVVVPDRTWQYQDDTINTAIKSVGLRSTHKVLNAAPLVLWGDHVANPGTPGDETRAVLSVDYSKSGLDVGLFADYRGAADSVRKVYDQQLGADHRKQSGHLQAVEALLREVSKPPLGRDHSGNRMPDEIKQVILYGDSVMDEGFLDTLKAVVGSDVVDTAHSFDRVFAPSVGMAMASFERMDDLDFDVEPAFGCRWRSRLYYGVSEELEL